MVRLKQTLVRLVFAACILVCIQPPLHVLADNSASTNYKVEQTFFGTGGELDASSTNYRAKQTAGELGVGFGSSANYRMQAGFNTTDDPFLEFVVTGSNIDLGYLDTATASTANGTFSIRAWQSNGYVVTTESDPPTNTNGGYQLSALGSPTASAVGTEQFGINLVANTSPATFGTAPQQLPDGTFSFGAASTGYNTANQYKYVKGDAVAAATQSSSITVFTVSYIFNISQTTAAGRYNFAHTLVATATY